MRALDDIHRHFAQPFDRERGALTGRDRNGRNEAAGDDDHTRFEIAAALGDVIGEPGQRGGRIFGGAFADKLAAEREPAPACQSVPGNDFETTEDYFATMGIHLLAGRGFSAERGGDLRPDDPYAAVSASLLTLQSADRNRFRSIAATGERCRPATA